MTSHMDGLVVGGMLLTNTEAAREVRLSPRTLEKLRTVGGGPRFVRLGRRVCYRPVDLTIWIESNVVTSTAQADQR
ncbi:MAG: helix-turn-helix domain-containing protein [Vicinamibacteria bacterium]